MLLVESFVRSSIGDFFQTAPQKEKGKNYKAALDFVTSRFMKVAQGHESRITVFITQATDQKQAQSIIDDTVLFITMKNLTSSIKSF